MHHLMLSVLVRKNDLEFYFASKHLQMGASWIVLLCISKYSACKQLRRTGIWHEKSETFRNKPNTFLVNF